METRLKRYLASRKLDRSASQLNLSQSTPAEEYDFNTPPKAEKSTSRRFFTAMRDSPVKFRGTGIDEFLASPYTATTPGKQPIYVGTPVHGNGPVKLQTCRRLATGELIVTQQDQERTLADIREGQYIVGKKEPRRPSSQQSQQPGQRKISKNDIKHPEPAPPRSPSPIQELPTFPSDSRMSGSSSQRGRSRTPSQGQQSGVMKQSMPRHSSSMSPGRSANSTIGEEPNVAIEALWKAENSRLVTLFGPNEASRADSSSPRVSGSQQGQLPLSPPSRAMSPFSPNSSPRPGVNSSLQDVSSLWSHDPRTNMRSPEPNSTREDIRTMVENMRSTYLTAMDGKPSVSARNQGMTKRAPRRRSRTYNHSPNEDAAISGTQTRQKRSSIRRSWHADHSDMPNEADGLSSAGLHYGNKQRAAHRGSSGSRSSFQLLPPDTEPPAVLPPLPHDANEDQSLHVMSTIPDEPAETVSEEEITGRPTLARADSMTLGPLLKATTPKKIHGDKASRTPSHDTEQDQLSSPPALSETQSGSVRDSLPSTISTSDFHSAAIDHPTEAIPRLPSTSTLTTPTTLAAKDPFSTMNLPSKKLANVLESPVGGLAISKTQPPNLLPESIIYDPDDTFNCRFDFDCFFLGKDGNNHALLRTVKSNESNISKKEPPHADEVVAPITSSI